MDGMWNFRGIGWNWPLALLLVATWGRASVESPVKVLVTVPPYVEIAKRIGGPWIEVESLLHAGESHENFAPTPGRVGGWRTAQLYLACGLDLEAAMRSRLETIAPDLKWIEGEKPEEHAADADHAHRDPHRWLDPREVAEDAERLAAALIALRPDSRAEVETRLARFREECAAMERTFRERFAAFSGQRIYVYHGAWSQLAGLLGIEQEALDEGGRAPSLRRLAQLVEQARQDGARGIFVDPVHQGGAAERFAAAIGGEIISLDPLDPAWEASLRATVEALYLDLSRRAKTPQ